MHRPLEVEMCGQRRQVVGVIIHVMAITGLGGAAMAAPVVGYDAIALFEEEQHLRVPIIGRQRPAMAEHDGLSFAPVLVINLRAVFRSDSAHRWLVVVGRKANRLQRWPASGRKTELFPPPENETCLVLLDEWTG